MKTQDDIPNPQPEDDAVAPAPETPDTEAAAPAPDESAVIKDQFLRLRADFDNYRKRVARDQIEVIKRANEDLIESLLPALDHFGSAESMMAQKAGAEAAPYLEGFKMVKNELLRALETHGLKSIPALGEKFDANLHEAISTQPASEAAPAGSVVFEVAKGYTLHGRVLRASRVVVAEEAETEVESSDTVGANGIRPSDEESSAESPVKKPPFGSARSRFVE
ncbi:MAG: nucleotide exchange factor GrpE [Kiritimatiellaeota bacterium]|nr:nucleotide exchange factor GrpE [Kiritimatiellota bacterium]